MSILDVIKSNKPHDILSHYTTQDGLIGIFNSKTIRTTKVSCLNDSSEYNLGLKITKEILETFKQSGDYRVENIKIIKESIDIIGHLNIFVASFTENGDLLSQWRAYGNASGGYSLGFSGSKLADEARNQGFFLTKCIYKPEEQRKLISEVLHEYLSIDYDLSNDEIEKPIKFLFFKNEGTKLLDNIASLSAIFKHEGFREEKEWRLISNGPKSAADAKYRSGQSFLIPYYEIKLDQPIDFLDNITIGPTPHPDVARDTLDMFLLRQDTNYKEKLKIKHTKIPFRDW